jgi:hypothetical protein
MDWRFTVITWVNVEISSADQYAVNLLQYLAKPVPGSDGWEYKRNSAHFLDCAAISPRQKHGGFLRGLSAVCWNIRQIGGDAN